ncbi:adenylate kinase isoenzyme 5-like [Amphiprion ocellaris]|uniref:adenylate kinase isoenzyme 5-like n=1 Tax=Amphiprion ocellaris TaxID=80972 RepID=UPI002410CB1A|nr:adenylate kinase isoenzyme 5-like [Amphiprion ocellaris]
MSSRQVKEYLSHHHISQLLESLLTGLLFHRPEDPLRFLQDALKRTRTLGGPEAVSWDTFIHHLSPLTSKTPPDPQIIPHTAALLPLIAAQIPPAPPRVPPPAHPGPPAVSMMSKAPILPPLTTSVCSTSSTHKTPSATLQAASEHRTPPPPPSKPAGAPPEPTGAPREPTGPPSKPTGAPPEPAGAPSEPAGAQPEPTGPPSKPTGAPPEPAGAPPEPTGPPSKPTGAPLVHTEVMQPDRKAQSEDGPPGPGSSSVLPPGPPGPGSLSVLPLGPGSSVVHSQLSIESDSDMTESSGLLQEVNILPSQRPHPLIIFIIGGPGSGKGSQTTKLTAHFGFRGLSLDELLRRQLLTDSTPGRRWELMSELMSHGELGTQEDTVSELRQQLIGQQEVGGVIVDGFPRDIHQALSFQEQVGSPDLVLMLVCSNEMLRGRLQRRAARLGLLGDGDHTLQRRLDRFQRDIVSISRYYRQLHLLTQVDADRDLELVFADLSSAVKEKLSVKTQAESCTAEPASHLINQ